MADSPRATAATHRLAVPIKVRLLGRPTDGDLDRLSETVGKAVAGRLALAHRTLTSTARPSKPAHHPTVRLHDAGRIRLREPETGTNIYRFLASVRRRISALRFYRLDYTDAGALASTLTEVHKTAGKLKQSRAPLKCLADGLPISSYSVSPRQNW